MITKVNRAVFNAAETGFIRGAALTCVSAVGTDWHTAGVGETA